MDRQEFSQLQESMAPSHVMVTWEDKSHYSKCAPFLHLSPDLYIAEHDIIQYGISLWSVGVSCPGCVPSHLLVHPQPTHWWESGRCRRILEVL